MGCFRKQRNLATAINKQSKLAYFREICDGSPKNNRYVGQSNLLCPINPRLLEIKSYFRKGTR